jgi:hypothetical protein
MGDADLLSVERISSRVLGRAIQDELDKLASEKCHVPTV